MIDNKKVTEKMERMNKDGVLLIKERVKQEMRLKDGMGSGKNKRFTLTDLADVLGLDDVYLRRIIWKERIKPEYAEKIANYFGVYLQYLAGIWNERNEDESKNAAEKEAKEHVTNAIKYLESIGYEIKLLSYDLNEEICPTPFRFCDIGLHDETKYDEMAKL